MNDTLLQQFEKNWNSFLASLRGNLSREKNLSYPAAETALESARTDWIAPDTVYGRWFMKVEKENPQIAKVISDILSRDMKFAKQQQSKVNPAVWQHAIPVAGAGVAGGSYHLLVQAAPVLNTVAISLITAGLLYVVSGQAVNNVRSTQKQKMIDAYIAQLSVYHDAVVAALQA